MKYKYINKYILVLFIFLMGFAVYMQYSAMENTKIVKQQEIDKTKIYAQNIISYIKKRVPNDLEKKLLDKKLRKELNSVLQAFITDKYQYIFVLDKPNDKYYRFLLDGSPVQKEAFHSIFFPKSSVYDEVYKHKKIKVIKQKDSVANVWISVLAPIVYDDKTEALLVLDLSKQYVNYLESFNSPLVKLIGLMQIFLVVSIIVLLILFYRYYKFKKHILVDKTTGAYTRQYLDEFFSQHNLDMYHALMIDIDEFRVVNTKFGYEVGNKVLFEFVEYIKDSLKDYDSDFVFRIGGGEFIIILPKNSNISLGEFCDIFFKKLKHKKYFVKNEVVDISISMSAISIPQGTTSWYRVLRILDEKLLEIKNRGKNDFDVIDDKDNVKIKYSDINYIKDKLDNEGLVSLYQPIFDTKTKQIVKYETLVRLYDEEEDKVISPYFFLDVIRGTSQYIKMSRLIFKNVFDTLAKYPDIELSVNFHLDDLYNTEMMQMIEDILSKHNEYAHRLTFEILEDKEIFDYEKVNSVFSKLKVFGSKIAIDDFGSGYANYNYLIKLDIDLLKIDGSIIKELLNNPTKTKKVISSIKQLADSLGYEVIAEFISEQKVYDYMLELDIKYSQGFYLGEPKPISEYVD